MEWLHLTERKEKRKLGQYQSLWNSENEVSSDSSAEFQSATNTAFTEKKKKKKKRLYFYKLGSLRSQESAFLEQSLLTDPAAESTACFLLS